MSNKLEALSALYKYMLAAGVYADMSNAELASELLSRYGHCCHQDIRCVLCSARSLKDWKI